MIILTLGQIYWGKTDIFFLLLQLMMRFSCNSRFFRLDVRYVTGNCNMILSMSEILMMIMAIIILDLSIINNNKTGNRNFLLRGFLGTIKERKKMIPCVSWHLILFDKDNAGFPLFTSKNAPFQQSLVLSTNLFPIQVSGCARGK